MLKHPCDIGMQPVYENGGTFAQKLLSPSSPNTDQTRRVKGTQWEKLQPQIYTRSAPMSLFRHKKRA
jgi:hypothetical protein